MMWHLDLANKVAESGIKKGAEYIDVRMESSKSTSIRISRCQVEEAGFRSIVGAGVRVLYKGSWGFASTEDLSLNSLSLALDAALSMAKASAERRKGKSEIRNFGCVKEKICACVEVNPLNVQVEEKIALMLDADERLRSDYRIKDDRVSYLDEVFKKYYVNSEGAEIVIEGARVRALMYATAASSGVITPALDVVAQTGGFEIFRKKDPVSLAESVAERAVKLLEASVPKGGLTTAVLDNDLLGLIVHEAFGHTAEADLVLSGTILTGKIGEKVASKLVTIIDSPGPEHAFGWTPYDDEGVKARDVVIVENGVLKEYMHTRETAAIMGTEPTGNGRAQNYSYAPLVRMRNTYMAPGSWNPEEIIAETREGWYLKKGLHGQADANGEFMFAVQEAWEIKNGELVKPYRGVAVSGNAIDVLKSIDAVGKDLIIESPGFCGKMQSVPVDGGGPHVRCKIIVGGR
ncbi:MAG: TldD/PmbA family protein [Thermoprotei archaeon]|nr:MAG: TldD/PmbA family protein [Thermoprotei archaeon]